MGCHLVVEPLPVGANLFARIGFDSWRLKSPLQTAIEWLLTPGRLFGVVPQEVDEDFGFERAMRDIHLELADLNQEAFDLAAKIQTNFGELGI